MTADAPHRAQGIGAALPRTEDLRLLRGQGTYTDDFLPDGAAHAVFVRSPHAHADIKGIDVAAAKGAPGALAVLTGADAQADGLAPMPHNTDWSGPPDAELRLADGFKVFTPPHPVLPAERVRYVGEPVALVIAESLAAAWDAAELVDVTYAPLAAVTDARAALAPDAPAVWPARPDNRSMACDVGDADATANAFAGAAHVVRLASHVNRVTGAPMEPRAAVATYDAERGYYTLRASSGRGAVSTRERVAKVLGIDEDRIRVHFGDMGGNFGTRNPFYPEHALIPWAAGKIERPVTWTATRSECFLSDCQGRDLALDTELALDADGRFLAMRGTNILNLGAYTAYFWPLRKGLTIMQGVYRVPCVHFHGVAAFTNTPPVAVYRSAGRPEVIYILERLIDMAAAKTGLDRVEIRRRNLIEPEAMPFTTAVGVTYDSGDYEAAMDQALTAADWDGVAARKAASAENGLRRGAAVANYIEVTSGVPRERAELRVTLDGTVELVVGTASSGQGHETSFAQVASDWLGVPFAAIRFIANDTDRVSVGGGSHSGRSMRLIMIALRDAVDTLVARGKMIVAHVLQVADSDITYAKGRFTAPDGTAMDIWQVAEQAATLNSLPADLRGAFEGVGDIVNRAGGYPYGTHVCEVEVDPDTGQVRIDRWTGVDDVGLAVNPLILHGQAHGAIAQGLGQALMENIHYDPDNAQLLSATFMDYALPRADTTPSFTTLISETPASSHPDGVRPGGEGGTTPALGLIINAIVDALKDDGVTHLEMPATPERVWRALCNARGG